MDVRVPDVCGGEAPHTGTTIIAVAFNGGVVLGADTRVTTGKDCPLVVRFVPSVEFALIMVAVAVQGHTLATA